MKQRGRLVVLLGLVTVLVLLQFRQPRQPAGATPAENRRATRAGASASLAGFPDSLLEIKQHRPEGHLAAARRNIFDYGWRASAPSAPVEVAAAPPPPAPLRFYGFAERGPGGKRQVFLTDGEAVYLAAEGDIVLRRYRILRVRNESIELEEVSGQQRWVVPLEQP